MIGWGHGAADVVFGIAAVLTFLAGRITGLRDCCDVMRNCHAHLTALLESRAEANRLRCALADISDQHSQCGRDADR